ncbi:Replicative DNA helicase [bioreactor metagenome]|uniref:DNA 5'-3' helicase n=1 Tax=bioreactor metagenome TaxID=1076179 RepID=A0A645BEP9_9ZZZZ
MEQNSNDINIIQKRMPHDTDAEQAVLSSAFMDRDAASEAFEILKAEDFYAPENRAVFEAAYELYSKGVPIDVVTVKNKLEEKNIFAEIGGVETLANIIGAVGSSVNVRSYAKIVEEKAVLRRLIKLSGEISENSYKGSGSINDILDKAEKGIFDVMQNRNTDSFSSIMDVAYSTFAKIEEIYSSDKKITGISTGFVDFDAKTAGLQKSDLILIAARPSMGKTAFALNVAQNAAVKQKIPVAIFSLEMSKEQLVNRMLCAEALVDAQKVRTGELNSSDWNKLVEAMGVLSEAPIYIDDTPGISAMDIRAKCRRLKIEKGLGLVVIDYLQLMSGNGRNDSRQQEISEISRSLKSVAREIDAPVIALSQLSRACEQRADHRPMLSDLRESGAIEQDADVVSFLYRDEYYFPESEKKNIAELIIAKQRNGPTGTVNLTWLGQYTKFANLAPHY